MFLRVVSRALLAAGLLAGASAPAHAASIAPMIQQITEPLPRSPSATLVLTVKNVSKKGGDLRIGVYDSRNYDNNSEGDHSVAGAIVPASPDETTVVIKNIPPGTYAIKMMQDENRNGKFDQSWIGLPLEPYGFSNDAKPALSEPPFDVAKITLKPGANTATIHLQ